MNAVTSNVPKYNPDSDTLVTTPIVSSMIHSSSFRGTKPCISHVPILEGNNGPIIGSSGSYQHNKFFKGNKSQNSHSLKVLNPFPTNSKSNKVSEEQ